MSLHTALPRTAQHPLEPLTAAEIEAAAAILREEQALTDAARFISISLHEPPKAAVMSAEPGDLLDREAIVVIRDAAARATYEAVVSISGGEVRSWTHREDAQAPITVTELLRCEEVVREDPRWQEAVRRRGVEDLSLAMVDPWPTGYNGEDDAPARARTIRPLTWVRSHPGDNGYARPVENLVVHFDLDAMQVLDVEDHGVVALPPHDANYSPEAITRPENFPRFPAGVRTDLKPVMIHQPEGPSFTVEGHEVRWQKWVFRVGFTYREGLVLHTVGYEDQGRLRPLIYRASLSEMFVPYGDPSPSQYRKNVFDMGEFGLGIWTNSLERGCDCLGEIHYFDGVINDEAGNAVTVPNAICLHEEDDGILWKHVDFRSGQVEVRRSRRLVISSIVTVGNYEYGFFWYLHQDGTIGYEVKLTGVISNGAIAEGEEPAYGQLVAPGVYGPNHQHFFNVRLDMTVDGPDNTVMESESEAVEPGPDNPYGNAWKVKRRALTKESEAQRTVAPLTARSWTVVNEGSRNVLGRPVGYRLVPGDNVQPFYQPDAHALKRAGFTERHVWVTAYEPTEMFAAGDYPNQHPGGGGLPEYVSADRPLENTDVVLWYTFGAHHVVRPEDWPVMPVTRIGFHLKPDGFFDGNPALDVPPS